MINDAILAARPEDLQYDKVAVLSVHWENDDLGVAPLSRELMDLFSKSYGFNTESCEIAVKVPGGIQFKS